MSHAEIDFETYSEAGFVWDDATGKWGALPNAPSGKKGLPVVGAALYAMHPTTEVLSVAYRLPGGDWRHWKPGDPPPLDLFRHVMAGGLLEAWNAPFEAWVWSEVCTPRMHWPPVRPEQWRDAMAKARARSLPGSLARAGAVLALDVQKDADGDRLLRKFSMPRNPTKTDRRRRTRPSDDPEDAARLYTYNVQDIRAEAAISERVPDLPPPELTIWQTDARINRRGVAVDVAGIEACCAVIDQAHERYNAELAALTGGTVRRASEVAKLTGWLAGRGVHADGLDEEEVSRLLAMEGLPTDCRRALEIRSAVGSAAVKKAYALRNRTAPTGRVYDLFNYYGARTGRVTGDGPQPTNFPNSGPAVQHCECGAYYGQHLDACPHCGNPGWASKGEEWGPEAVEFALSIIGVRSLDLAEYYFGDAMAAVSGCLRGLFIAAPDHDLICSDYSAIEAVVLAELAGEEWRREVFRTHGKIYETSAASITGIPLEEILDHKARTGQHHPARKSVGKVAELALGYQGWVGAWKAFDGPGTDEEIRANILAWRAASPAIVEFWGGQERNWKPELYGIEGAAVAAILSPGEEMHVRGHRLQVRDDVLYLRLLSGRELAYHRPRLAPSDRRPGTWSISYEGNNTNPKNGPTGWIRVETWGGRLVENIVQATARDLQWHGIVTLERAGYPVVLHVYDEDVAEVPEGFGSVEEFERVMSTMPHWAAGWPVRASGGWRRKRYGK